MLFCSLCLRRLLLRILTLILLVLFPSSKGVEALYHAFGSTHARCRVQLFQLFSGSCSLCYAVLLLCQAMDFDICRKKRQYKYNSIVIVLIIHINSITSTINLSNKHSPYYQRSSTMYMYMIIGSIIYSLLKIIFLAIFFQIKFNFKYMENLELLIYDILYIHVYTCNITIPSIENIVSGILYFRDVSTCSTRPS